MAPCGIWSTKLQRNARLVVSLKGESVNTGRIFDQQNYENHRQMLWLVQGASTCTMGGLVEQATGWLELAPHVTRLHLALALDDTARSRQATPAGQPAAASSSTSSTVPHTATAPPTTSITRSPLLHSRFSLVSVMPPQTYYLVSLPASIAPSGDASEALTTLRSAVTNDNGTTYPFNIPHFKIGTLDALVQQADELARLEGGCKGVVDKVADSLRTLLEGDEDKIQEQKVVNDSESGLGETQYIEKFKCG